MRRSFGTPQMSQVIPLSASKFIAGLTIILLLTYKIVASCILGLEVLQNNMHERSKMFKGQECVYFLKPQK
jgi:hypothetical protein